VHHLLKKGGAVPVEARCASLHEALHIKSRRQSRTSTRKTAENVQLQCADLSMDDAITMRRALLELSRRSHVSRSKSEQRQLKNNVSASNRNIRIEKTVKNQQHTPAT
jgi:hypothetical protein